MATNVNDRGGFRSIKGLTKLFKSDIPARDGGGGAGAPYGPGPRTVKQWKERVRQEAPPVTDARVYSPPKTLEYVIRKADTQRNAETPATAAPASPERAEAPRPVSPALPVPTIPPTPAPPVAPSSTAPAHTTALQNGHDLYARPNKVNVKQNKNQGKKTFRNYVFINEFDSHQPTANQNAPPQPATNGMVSSNESVNSTVIQYYADQDAAVPPPRRPVPSRKPVPQRLQPKKTFNVRRVKVFNIRNGAVGVKEKFAGQFLGARFSL